MTGRLRNTKLPSLHKMIYNVLNAIPPFKKAQIGFYELNILILNFIRKSKSAIIVRKF